MSSGLAVVIGLGRSGIACARVLSADGFAVRVVERNDDDRLRRLAAELPPEVEVVLGGYDDDVVADVEGALAAGLRAVLIDREERRAALPPGVQRVRSVAELVAGLDS